MAFLRLERFRKSYNDAPKPNSTFMAPPALNLKVLDQLTSAQELDLASELFHRINRLIPQDQSLLTVPPHCRVREAVALMQKHGYSQVPVISNGEVLGVFSFRSFTREAANASLEDLNRQKTAPGDLTVDEFLERFEFARVTEEMSRVFDAMDRDSGILIGTPEHLVGILTPMDFLRYLYRVASPFVMVSEIELALRALIRITMTPEQIASSAEHCLPGAYGERRVPNRLEDMTFENYQSLSRMLRPVNRSPWRVRTHRRSRNEGSQRQRRYPRRFSTAQKVNARCQHHRGAERGRFHERAEHGRNYQPGGFCRHGCAGAAPRLHISPAFSCVQGHR